MAPFQFDLQGIAEAIGYPGIAGMVFAETGLLVGFFLPGDTLLITAGLLAQRGVLSLWTLLPLLILAAIAGDATGYFIGRRAGPRLFVREESRLWKPSRLHRARQFYDRHGGKTILLARYVGFLRTFAPTVAGAAEMAPGRFMVYNVAGGLAWVATLVLGGFAAGHAVERIDVYLGTLFGVAFLLSASAVAIGWARRRPR